MAKNSDNILWNLERRHGVQGIKSEARGLYYLQDDDRTGIGILTIIQGRPHYALLTREQLKVMIREIKDIYDVMFD